MKVGVLVESMGAGGGKAMPDLEQVNFFRCGYNFMDSGVVY